MLRLSSLSAEFSKKLYIYQSIWAPVCMVLLVLLTVTVSTIHYQGDIDEYILMSAAMADHGTPAIRPSDVARVADQLPVMKPVMEQIAEGMAKGQVVPKPGFYQAQSGDYFAIHFFAYSAVVAVPFKLFELLGVPPLKAFLLVNLLAVCAVAVSARVFWGDWIRATATVFLWMVCGGINYLYWLGPEILSAALLTSAGFLYLGERRIWAGLCIGFAALQNPPIILALAFVPLLKLVLNYEPERSFWVNCWRQVDRVAVLAILLGALLFLSAIVFNLWAFATPNIIVKVATNPSLMGTMRLFSFFFDLNQGMLIGFAGIWLALLLALWKHFRRPKFLCAFVLSCLFSISLALPALTTGNWNSGAIGMMRYAFWAGIPFFLLLMCMWRQASTPKLATLSLIFVLQLGLTAYEFANLRQDFNSVSKLVMRFAPSLYNPEPELFIERSMKHDGEEMNPQKVYAFQFGERQTKRLYHPSNTRFAQQLCGHNARLKQANAPVEAGYGWLYVNGDVICERELKMGVDEFDQDDRLVFGSGWSQREFAGGEWSGRWSDGATSELRIQGLQEFGEVEVSLKGHYYQKNHRTEVRINGRDFGWHDLSTEPRFRLRGAADGYYELSLRHEAPQTMAPIAAFPHGRRLSLFLNSVSLLVTYRANSTTAAEQASVVERSR